jgi:Tfp pilus assembly protein PilV
MGQGRGQEISRRRGGNDGAKWRCERGYTLVEVLIATVLCLVAFIASANVLIAGMHSQTTTANRMSALQTLQASLAQMTNELRPAASVAYVSGQANLSLAITPPGGTTASVKYDCYTTSGKCMRTSGGTQTGVFASSVSNSDVFTLECRTSTGDLQAVANGGTLSGCANGLDYVKIRLVSSVPCTGQGNLGSCPNGTIEVDGGTSLRNQA